MDIEVEKAIEIAWGGTNDQNLKTQAFEFLNQLRSNPAGPPACLTLFTRTPRATDPARLVALDVVIHAIQSQTPDLQALIGFKERLLDYVRRTYSSGSQEPIDTPALQNKLAQAVTFLFIALYKQGWENFVDDFLSLTSSQGNGVKDHTPGIILYLRILTSVHDEIADQLIARQGDDSKRNTELKDLFRTRDVPKVVASWQDILAQYKDRDDGIVEMTLKAIARWVSWIDIGLIVQQEILGPLFQLVARTSPENREDRVRNAAVDTFTEIVAKKMKPSEKIGMIAFLNLTNIITQLVSSRALSELRSTSSYDTDYAEVVAKLVNVVVGDVVKTLEDNSAEGDTRAQAEQLVQGFLPLLLRFFSDEYDEVCSTVIPSLTDLLTCFRKAPQPLPPVYQAMLPPILNAIIQKMKYDETASWGSEDEQTDEAEFQELRKRLQILQKTVAAVDQNLYIEVLSNIVGTTLTTPLNQLDWRDLDLALHEMFLFGELSLTNSSLYQKSQPSSVAAERLIVMMSKMIDSDIANFNHPAIQLQYMEICVRYTSFFETQTSYIPKVLEQFVRLVHHHHIRVRTRSWYLFHRFVKHLRAHVGSVAETVIQSISDLLPIKAEVPNEDGGDDDMSSDESDHSADATFSGQLWLFEAVGCIASTSTTPLEKQVFYARSILDPLFSDLERNLPAAKSGDSQAILQIHHLIMAMGTLAHGYSDWTPGVASTAHQAPKQEISDEFGRAAEAVLITLESLKTSLDIRIAARASFTRLLGVLGINMLPLLPRWIDGLLSQSSSKDEMATFLRLLDQVVFGFKKDIYAVLDSLLTPLLQRIFAGLAEPVTGTDDEVQLNELRREYLTFIQIIINNDLASVLVSDANQGFFEALIASVFTLAKTVTDSNALASSRLALSVLTRMGDIWGGTNVTSLGPSAVAPTIPQPAFPGFDQFLIERFHPICWDVLREPTFRPGKDAQAKQVLTEVAGLEQMIYLKTGDLFVNHLQQVFFPGLGVDGSEYLDKLRTSADRKVFANFLVRFLGQR